MLFHKQIKIGELLRNKNTRDVFLVVHKTTQGLFVINLMERSDPLQIYIILPRNNRSWERDIQIVDMSEGEAKFIEEQLENGIY
jgi:hypothetical protein